MKKIFIGIFTLAIGMFSAYALSNNFSIDSSKLFFVEDNKKNTILDNFNSDYELKQSISINNPELEEQITDLSKKMTYLLLGDFNTKEESNDKYYKRHQEYLSMGAYQTFPRDENSKTGYDESLPNYNYASISEFAVPSMFLKFNELGIQYNSYGDIRITTNGDLVISSVSLPRIRMKQENTEDPKKYDVIETNLVLTYYFIKIGNEYKLCYLYGETSDHINEYFTELENTESKFAVAIAPSYNSELSQIYNFSKLNEVTEDKINNIYNINKNNIVILNSYYNNYNVSTSNGFFINEGLIVTTWSFLEKSLIEAQYITIMDNEGQTFEIEGIVTANPETDIVVIKLKNKVDKKVNLGNYQELKVEDPVITISSKTGVGLTLQKGIVVSIDSYLQTSIPLSENDQGSPLFDKNGNVIGINTAKQVDSSISMAINSEILKEVQEKFNNISFDTIKTITFKELKEQFYYVKFNDEIVEKNISKSKWNKYSKIGNIEETIKLKLLKANYKDGVVSLRYQNNVSNYISSMKLASAFKEQLIKDGYTELLKGNEKCIYKNNKYQIIIMDEFDYLIVVMVKL